MNPIRKQYLDGALDYVLKNGLANFSLRPMAAELGTSARILLYHFKSKEGLVRAILGELNARSQSSFVAMTSQDAPPHRGSALQRFWDWSILPANLPYWRLHFELNILAIQNPVEYGRYRQDLAAQWQMLALKSLSESRRSEPTAVPVVTLAIAVFDGLMLELIGGADAQRLTLALDHFIALASKPA
jgi:AcrR family transcriptional regulator